MKIYQKEVVYFWEDIINISQKTYKKIYRTRFIYPIRFFKRIPDFVNLKRYIKK